MILVKRLVLRETNIPVDPRKIRTGSAARIEIRIKFQCRGREFLQQAPERLNNGSLIAVAVHLHPLLAVVAAQVLEKLKRFAREHRHLRCHGASVSNADAVQCPTAYTIPRRGQFIGQSRLALAAMYRQPLVCGNEQLYSDRKNKSPPEARARQLRPRTDLLHSR